jgi:tetratricopeptide (TPR) repeat protein
VNDAGWIALAAGYVLLAAAYVAERRVNRRYRYFRGLGDAREWRRIGRKGRAVLCSLLAVALTGWFVALGAGAGTELAAWSLLAIPPALGAAAVVMALISYPFAAGPLMNDEEDAWRTMARSQALIAEGMFGENRALVADAIQRHPNSPTLRLRAAVSLFDVPDARAESLAHVREAVTLAPSDPSVLFQAAHAMQVQGEFREAREYLDRARAKAPSDFPLAMDIVELDGLLLEEEGDFADAEARLREAYEAEPHELGRAANLANLLGRQGRFVDGLEVAADGLRRRPGDDQLRAIRDELLRCLQKE